MSKESRKNFRVSSKSRNESPMIKPRRNFTKINSMKNVKRKLEYYIQDLLKYYKMKKKNYFNNIFKDHFKHSFISMQFCKNMKPPKKSVIAMKKAKFPRKARDLGKQII